LRTKLMEAKTVDEVELLVNDFLSATSEWGCI
jgi:hypothetical protein